MKIAVQIAGARNGNPIDVPLSVESDGHLTFQVPSSKPRLAACTFSVDLEELQQAIGHLAPTRPQQGIRHASGAEE